jgi:hypothetical protein
VSPRGLSPARLEYGDVVGILGSQFVEQKPRTRRVTPTQRRTRVDHSSWDEDCTSPP